MGHPSCSDSWPQLHLGQGVRLSSGLESPHLAAITGLFSLCLPDNDPYHKNQLKWVKTRERKNEGHLR